MYSQRKLFILAICGVIGISSVWASTAHAALTFGATSIASDGAFALTGGSASTVTLGATASPFVLEGATANDFELTIAMTDPTADLTITLPNATTTLVGHDTTDTLSNKTLTAPRFADLGFLADANGNEQLIFDSTESAVNELTIGNAATGNNVRIITSGADTNIGLTIAPKGTGMTIIQGNDPENFGPFLALQHLSASPAVEDVVGALVFAGRDVNLASQNYAFITTEIMSTVSNQQVGRLVLNPIGAGAVTQIQSSNSGSVGPILDLNHASSSPEAGDIIGQIFMEANDSSGNSTNFSQLKTAASVITADAEYGEVRIDVTTNGNANTNILEIDGLDGLRMNSRRFQGAKGAAVNNLNNTTLGNDGNYFQFSNTTQLNCIDGTNWQSGSMVTLRFGGDTTITDGAICSGQYAAIQLSGNISLSAGAGDTLTLLYDSAGLWYEIARADL